MNLWEYRIVMTEDVSKMNELGAEGWELVSTTGVGSFGNPTRCIFKRSI